MKRHRKEKLRHMLVASRDRGTHLSSGDRKALRANSDFAAAAARSIMNLPSRNSVGGRSFKELVLHRVVGLRTRALSFSGASFCCLLIAIELHCDAW